MTQQITFIVQLEVETANSLSQIELGQLLRPNVKEHVLDINKHWLGGVITRIEAVYIPKLLP